MDTNKDQKMAGISEGIAFGKLAGRVTAVALMLYVISLIYRAGGELAALTLGGVVALYVVLLFVRNMQYGYSPWEPVEWTAVPADKLDTGEHQRALRWTIALKFLRIFGAVSGLAVIFTFGLETLGYVLLIGGLPTLAISLSKHYSNGTRPWYPSVPFPLTN